MSEQHGAGGSAPVGQPMRRGPGSPTEDAPPAHRSGNGGAGPRPAAHDASTVTQARARRLGRHGTPSIAESWAKTVASAEDGRSAGETAVDDQRGRRRAAGRAGARPSSPSNVPHRTRRRIGPGADSPRTSSRCTPRGEPRSARRGRRSGPERRSLAHAPLPHRPTRQTTAIRPADDPHRLSVRPPPPSPTAAARAVDAIKVYGKGESRGPRARRRHRRLRRRPLHRHHGPVGLGQVDADALPRRPRHAHSGAVFIGDIDLSRAQRPPAHRSCAGTASASSSRRSTWCRRSPRSRTSRCRCASPAASPTRRGSTTSSTPSGSRNRLKHRPSRALRRPAAARRRRPGPRQPAGDHLRRRADRQPRLPHRRRDPRRSCARAVRELGQTIVMVTHDPVAASLRRPGRVPRRRPHRRRDRRPDRRLPSSTASRASEADAMFRLTLKELAAKQAAAPHHGLAVLLGVAFMAGTLVLTDTIAQDLRQRPRRRQRRHRRLRPGRQSAIDLGFGEHRPAPRRRARRHGAPPSTASTRPRCASTATPSSSTRRQAGRRRQPRAPALGTNWVDRRRPQPVPARRAATRPRADDEIVIDKHSRRHAGYQPGDVGDACSRRARPASSPIAGIATFGDADSPAGATAVLFTDATAAAAAGRRRAGRRRSPSPPTPACRRRTLAADRQAAVGGDVEVITGAQLIAEDQAGAARGHLARSARSCWSSPSSPCSSARSSSTTPSRSSSPSAPRRWRCCGPSAPAAAR